MSDLPASSVPSAMISPAVAAEGSKKRKRTGKEREERKKAALEAQRNADMLLAAARGEAVPVAAAAAAAAPASTLAAVPAAATSEEGQAGTGAATHVGEREGDVSGLEQAEVGAEGEGKKGPDVEAIAKRIPQALKSLHPLFKKAKAFETSRLIKKIKFIKAKDPKSSELADLEAQLEAMHRIPLHDIAQSHLHTKLSKHHFFKHTSLPAPLASILAPTAANSGSTSAATTRAKVDNRLISNKVVAEGVKSVLGWTVGDEGARLGGAGKALPKASTAKVVQVESEDDDEDEDEGEEEEEEDDEMDIHRGPLARGLGGDGEVDGAEGDTDEVDEEDAAADAAGWESGSLGGDEDDEAESDEEEDREESDADSGVIEWSDAERYSVAGTDDGQDSDEEVGADEADEGAETDGSSSFIAAPPSKRSKSSSGTDAVAASSTKPNKSAKADKAATSSTPASSTKAAREKEKAKGEKREPQVKVKAAKPAKEAKSASVKIDKNITSSLFLPSLSVGFAPAGDSDSDPDLDADVDGSGIIGKKGVRERKNRRGQRARQAIWEKKYGKNAKHVVKNNELDKQKAEAQVQSATQSAYARRGQLAANPYPAGASGASASATPSAAAGSGGANANSNANGYAPKKKTLNPNANIVDDQPRPAASAGAGGSRTQGLHPSWAAAKMRQKQLAEGPKATKITFD